MHLEFQPADAPDPAYPDVQFGVAPEQIITELLELCEEFLRQASPLVHAELRQFLTNTVTTAVWADSSTPSASPPSRAPPRTKTPVPRHGERRTALTRR